MKRLMVFLLGIVLLLTSGCANSKGGKENSICGADFFDFGENLYETEPYTIILFSSKMFNKYEDDNNYIQITDPTISKTKEYTFENKQLNLKYLCTDFKYTESKYGVLDYYINDEENILFGFRRSDNRLNYIKRLKIDKNPERKIYKEHELEKITDQLMQNLSGQKVSKMEVKRQDCKSCCHSTYTFMCGEYATPEQIIVIVDQYGEIYEYKRLSEYYGDFSIIDKKTVDFLRIEENTKVKVISDNKDFIVDNFSFSNKHLFFLADGMLCVGYNYSYEQTDNSGTTKEIIREAFATISKLEGGAKYREKNNVLGLRADDLYYVGAITSLINNSPIKNIPEGTWGGEVIFNTFYNFAKGTKSIVIDEKELELIYETTRKFFDPSDNKLKSYDYYHYNSPIRPLQVTLKQNSDEICFLNWIYIEENSSEEDKRNIAEEFIKENFDVNGFNYEYDPVTNRITYTKMIGKFYTNKCVYSTLNDSFNFISNNSWANNTPNINEPQIDIANLKDRITKSLNERFSDEIFDVEIKKMTISRFFETILIDIEVLYSSSKNQPNGSQINNAKFKYILGEVENK